MGVVSVCAYMREYTCMYYYIKARDYFKNFYTSNI